MGYLHLPMSCCSVVVGARGRRAKGDGETGRRFMGTDLGNALSPSICSGKVRAAPCAHTYRVLEDCMYINSCKRFLRPNNRASVGRPMAFHFFATIPLSTPDFFLRMWSACRLPPSRYTTNRREASQKSDGRGGRTDNRLAG